MADDNLPDPDDSPGTDVVLYDGQCNFCRAQVRRLRAFDWGGRRLSYLSLHDPRTRQRYPDLTHEMLMEQMYVVSSAGGRFGGSDAVRYLTRRLPSLWPAAPILHLPGTAWLWRWAYFQVAKRRYSISGKSDEMCETGACSIRPPR